MRSFTQLAGICVLALAACASDPEQPDVPAVPEQPAETGGAGTSDAYVTKVTAGGSYLVAWRPLPAPIPLNKSFAVEVLVYDAEDPTQLLEQPRVLVDAGMPQHGHGMNRKPLTEPLGGGRHRVEGMLFHMPGSWELYVDVFQDRVSERARFEVEVE